jgi:hypothetical protein
MVRICKPATWSFGTIFASVEFHKLVFVISSHQLAWKVLRRKLLYSAWPCRVLSTSADSHAPPRWLGGLLLKLCVHTSSVAASCCRVSSGKVRYGLSTSWYLFSWLGWTPETHPEQAVLYIILVNDALNDQIRYQGTWSMDISSLPAVDRAWQRVRALLQFRSSWQNLLNSIEGGNVECLMYLGTTD